MCIFHSWGKVESGYQYCVKCGKARAVARKCEHVWVDYGNTNLHRDGKVLGYLFIQKCSKCGELKKNKYMANED